jgi:hypothetical protein
MSSRRLSRLLATTMNRRSCARFKERFYTVERVFGWEDKFRRLLLGFERLSQLVYAFETLTYNMINLRTSASVCPALCAAM